MKSYILYTKREKSGAIDALNLFFGALLGANLGTLNGLDLIDYIHLIVLLAGTVTFLRLVSTSERRRYVLLMFAGYGALLAALVTVPRLQPDGLSTGDLHRLVATLGIWAAFVLATELSPVTEHVGKAEPPKLQE